MLEKCTTQGIEVEAQSFFVPEQSDLLRGQYFFSYRIRIANNSPKTVQLLARSWTIIDGVGRIETVEGAGVVGLQPRLEPGQSFEYESFCPLETPSGLMKGRYQMLCLESGDNFDAEIPSFFLNEPSAFH